MYFYLLLIHIYQLVLQFVAERLNVVDIAACTRKKSGELLILLSIQLNAQTLFVGDFLVILVIVSWDQC